MIAERHKTVVDLTRRGRSTSEIAKILCITERSVTRIRSNCGVAKEFTSGTRMDDDELARARVMLEEGASIPEVARTLNRDYRTLTNKFPEFVMTQKQASERAALGRYAARTMRRLTL